MGNREQESRDEATGSIRRTASRLSCSPFPNPRSEQAVRRQLLAQRGAIDAERDGGAALVAVVKRQALAAFGVPDVRKIAPYRAADAFAQRAAGAGTIRTCTWRRGRNRGLGSRQSCGIHEYFPSRTMRRLLGPLRWFAGYGCCVRGMDQVRLARVAKG